MAWLDFMNHKCDIYHIQESTDAPGYGLPDSPAFSYPEEPDISGQICHFGVKNASISTTQEEPAQELSARIKLALPIDVDIRINDKIINCETGYHYMAEQPITVQKQHHKFVYIKRVDHQREL